MFLVYRCILVVQAVREVYTGVRRFQSILMERFFDAAASASKKLFSFFKRLFVANSNPAHEFTTRHLDIHFKLSLSRLCLFCLPASVSMEFPFIVMFFNQSTHLVRDLFRCPQRISRVPNQLILTSTSMRRAKNLLRCSAITRDFFSVVKMFFRKEASNNCSHLSRALPRTASHPGARHLETADFPSELFRLTCAGFYSRAWYL